MCERFYKPLHLFLYHRDVTFSHLPLFYNYWLVTLSKSCSSPSELLLKHETDRTTSVILPAVIASNTKLLSRDIIAQNDVRPVTNINFSGENGWGQGMTN